MLKRILAFHAECCRFARKQQRRNLRFKSKVLDHLKMEFQCRRTTDEENCASVEPMKERSISKK